MSAEGDSQYERKAANRRKKADLLLKSIWDEPTLTTYLPLNLHRTKLWNYCIQHAKSPYVTDNADDKRKVRTISDIPMNEWNFPVYSMEKIKEECRLFTTSVAEISGSSKGDTTKLLIRLQDGHHVETVVIRHRHHATVCISSQIGCQMGCRFCATGTMGIIGDLTAGEIVEQLVHANSVTKIRNVVFMGMGEPLKNYDNVKMAVQFMIDTKRFALSPRHVTVSTVGVLKNMYRLSDELPDISLALSLHAPNQEIRLKIVPSAGAMKIDKLMEAIDYHIKKNGNQLLNETTRTNRNNAIKAAAAAADNNQQDATTEEEEDNTDGNEKIMTNDEIAQILCPSNRIGGKRPTKVTGVMIEYILIHDINDRDEHAHELAQLLCSRRDYILLNLIPYNPTEVAEDYKPPTPEQVERFFDICSSEPYRVYTRVRQEKGQDIAGACGQLALVKVDKEKLGEILPLVDLEDLQDKITPNNSNKVTNTTDKRKEAMVEEMLLGFEQESISASSQFLHEDSIMKSKGKLLYKARARSYLAMNIFIPVALIAYDWMKTFI